MLNFQHTCSDINLEFFTIKDHIVPNKGCFIDVGAHLGFWSLFVAMNGTPVHSFEPNPFTFKKLQKRCSDHYPELITCHNCALGASSSSAVLTLHNHSGEDKIFVHAPEAVLNAGVSVQIRTLDSFKIPDIGSIKMDVEGHELQVIEGTQDTLSSQHPRLIIEVHEPHVRIQQVTDALTELDYSQFDVLRKDLTNMAFVVASQ